ncbi:MAG: AAA family ATPase [Planctomycetes bacterium]|nr:AAA family ATPase [Planctomycetota bacterium]
MEKLLVVTGRGGVGKSTFAALCARRLASSPLLIDADPDQSLASLLGIDLAAEGVNSISDVLYKLQDPKAYKELGSMPLAQKMEYLISLSCLYEGPQFDLLTLGVKWTRGCYCQPNNVLQSLIPSLAQNYRYTVLDSPAGLEHVNRRVVRRVNDIFALIDPSTKALRNARRLVEIAQAIGVQFGNLYLVGNYRFTAEAEQRARAFDGATYLGSVRGDEQVQSFDWDGRSLLDLPEDSPALQDVGAILAKAGYEQKVEG